MDEKQMLDEKLVFYSKSESYPFHMPGHKRQWDTDWNPYQIDITEIGGFDNLHHATGILRDAQTRASQLYGADKTYYLVNGSTCGILAAISAATKKGDRVLVARNCHKSVYHALYLRDLVPVYLYPTMTSHGLLGQIKPEDVKAALKEHGDISAVILTSPTYDGMVSDIEEIAKIAHQHQIPLIVDEAHGAHFLLSEEFPRGALDLGADVVVTGIHKTLPAFTQTALLHLKGNRVKEERVESFLNIYETSSPSYLLMAGMDRCIRIMKTSGNEMAKVLIQRLRNFYQDAGQLKNIKVLQPGEVSKEEAFSFDFTKILIFPGKTMSGEQLQSLLRKDYGIELEMACKHYALALSSIMDTREGFDRLTAALQEIDKKPEFNKTVEKTTRECRETIYRPMTKRMEISKAMDQSHRMVKLEDAVGRVCASYVLVYPPGIPLIVPGEQIDQQFIRDIQESISMGLEVEGASEEGINIVN